MNIVGLSAFYHDSAACLVRDGMIVAAAQEERFTRKKHDADFPRHALSYCLKAGGIEVSDIDVVAFYDKPILKFDRILETCASYAPKGYATFSKAIPLWLKEKLHVPRALDEGLNGGYRNRYVFLRHHESHASSAFFPSPFERAAVLTLDGAGEWATGTIGVGEGNRLELLREMRFPHSLGLLYSAFTYFAGFRVNSGEYKLMGLAPYGEPKYRDLMLSELVELHADGSFLLNLEYFAYCYGDTMTSPKMARLFGDGPRAPESRITKREMDIAASIQSVTEEVVLRSANHAHDLVGSDNLVLAGGVALNCVANGRLSRESRFRNIWVQPAAGDAGGALGAALFVWYQLMENPRPACSDDRQSGSLLGPEYSTSDVQAALRAVGAAFESYETEEELYLTIARLLAEQKVVGHFAGRMEFGPRALGNRSILGDPRPAHMQSTMNLKIKYRESFRPFAPAVLEEHVQEYFEMNAGQQSPYMLLVAPVHERQRKATDSGRVGIDKLKDERSTIPAVTHVDHSARIQTVDSRRNPRLHRIMTLFHGLTGCPVLVNTSLNVRGEPIVNTPEEAYRCFRGTEMDVLVIENCILHRDRQPLASSVAREDYLKQFAPD